MTAPPVLMTEDELARIRRDDGGWSDGYVSAEPAGIIAQRRALLSHIAALTARLAAAEADAARYRWLREHRSVTIDTALHGNGCRTHTPDELDAATDKLAAPEVPRE